MTALPTAPGARQRAGCQGGMVLRCRRNIRCFCAKHTFSAGTLESMLDRREIRFFRQALSAIKRKISWRDTQPLDNRRGPGSRMGRHVCVCGAVRLGCGGSFPRLHPTCHAGFWCCWGAYRRFGRRRAIGRVHATPKKMPFTADVAFACSMPIPPARSVV